MNRTTGKVATACARVLGGVLLAAAVDAQAVTLYTLQDLGTLGGSFSAATAINDLGQVVGVSRAIGETATRATLFGGTGGANLDLGTLGGASSRANAINDLGSVVGYAQTSAGIFQATAFGIGSANTDIGSGSPGSTLASSINDLGQIAGTSAGRAALISTTGAAPTFLGDLGGAWSEASSISDAGQVVGRAGSASGAAMRATLFSTTGAAGRDLGTLGGTNSLAWSINEVGQAVGTSQVAGDAVYRATLFSNVGGPNTDLGGLVSGAYSEARAINDLGQVVGTAGTVGVFGDARAFIWDSANGMRNLNSLLATVSEWTITDAVGINESGQIAANGYNRITNQSHALLLDPELPLVPGTVPEPGPLWLVGAAAIALGTVTTRRGGTRP